MVKMNYNIKIGMEFELPAFSWQMADISGNYTVVTAVDDDDEPYYICHSDETPYIVSIDKNALAYILGEEVEPKVNKVYRGTEFLPSPHDSYYIEVEEEGILEDIPFWYVSRNFDNRRRVDFPLWTGIKWRYLGGDWEE
jgi:hypothetical protein